MLRRLSQAKIIAITVDLMYALMQDRHDSNVPIRQPPPIDEMPFVPEEEALDAERRRNGFDVTP